MSDKVSVSKLERVNMIINQYCHKNFQLPIHIEVDKKFSMTTPLVHEVKKVTTLRPILPINKRDFRRIIKNQK